MARIGILSPWVRFYKEIEAMFANDPEVKVIYDEEANEVKLYVDNTTKANALAQLLPYEKTFGTVKLKITVLPANELGDSKISLFEDAFQGNPAFSYIKTVSGIFSSPLSYVVFKNKVVQYYNDDLGDVNGLCSTLYQDIAKNIFGEQDGIFFCTDVESDFRSKKTRLGEWS